MKSGIFAAMVLGLSVTLGGCGFTPLYGKPESGANVPAEFAAISVEDIDGRVGLEVRNNLIEILNPAGEPASPAYRLVVTLGELRQGLLVRSDASVTRYNYQLSGKYELRDAKTDKVMQQGEARAIAAYNVVESQFATYSAEKDAESRAARELAQEIRLRLGTALKLAEHK
ncbi:MAG: hypothetical protein HXY22_05910 [Alphaproteobacteria bacterium]|nr:hypothetical protein [Alphaproteobacteria bacterium]